MKTIMFTRKEPTEALAAQKRTTIKCGTQGSSSSRSAGGVQHATN